MASTLPLLSADYFNRPRNSHDWRRIITDRYYLWGGVAEDLISRFKGPRLEIPKAGLIPIINAGA